MGFGKAVRSLLRSGRAFGADRTGGPAMEFALVGTTFFLLLFFVIQGGIYFLRETILDYATETAARAVTINDNPGFSVAAPASAGAFLNLVASSGFGLLGPANYSTSSTPNSPTSSAPLLVALQMTPEIKAGTYGFSSITPYTFPNGGTPPYQFIYMGSCTVNYYKNYAVNGQIGSGVTSISSGSCALPAGDTTDTVCPNQLSYMTQNNQIINGLAAGGSPSFQTELYGSTPGGQYTYTNGTFTCNANQFVLVQVRYADFSIVPLISSFFGPIISTVAFKIEPPPT